MFFIISCCRFVVLWYAHSLSAVWCADMFMDLFFICAKLIYLVFVASMVLRKFLLRFKLNFTDCIDLRVDRFVIVSCIYFSFTSSAGYYFFSLSSFFSFLLFFFFVFHLLLCLDYLYRNSMRNAFWLDLKCLYWLVEYQLAGLHWHIMRITGKEFNSACKFHLVTWLCGVKREGEEWASEMQKHDEVSTVKAD